MTIRSAAVLGAGTMGAQIAAHLANAGIPVTLLDLTRDTAADLLKRAQALKPDPFFTKDASSRITIGGFDSAEDFGRLAGADWIVEAVVERLDVKQSLLARVDEVRKADAIVSSNTSGIPVASIVEGRSDSFRKHWLGTHFFNPPRYLKLLELIPTADTDPAVVSSMRAFADTRLGKGVVIAKDTPNFIANRIAMFTVMRCLEALDRGYTIEEIDAITGPAIGRPKSATFRTLDITGIDLLLQVSRNLQERLGNEAARWLTPPPIVTTLVERGWFGEKAGQGFYRKEASAGGSEILTLDPETMTYRARKSVRLPAIDATKNIDDPAERLRTLFSGKDRVGEFLRATLAPTILYAACVAPDIAYSIDDIDRAMSWGLGWDLGPFEIADAIGLREVIEACPADARPGGGVPPIIQARLDAGENTLRGGQRVPVPEGVLPFRVARTGHTANTARSANAANAPRTAAGDPVIKKNPGASLIDLGDGVLGLELHSKMNTIGGDTIAMLAAGVKEAERNFAALVVSTDAVNFSVGANLMLLLLEAQEGNWDEIDMMVRAFQQATMGLRLAAVPVVVAPAGLVLGGGCEMSMHADRLQAAAETYIGLVEVGVGLIPAGGGTKEFVARAADETLAGGTLPLTPQTNLLPAIQRAFETIAFAKVSTSAAEARTLGLLRATDRITMNRDRVLADAKALALARVAEGYQRPVLRPAIAVGGAPIKAALDVGIHLALRAARISEHDARIGRALAHIMAGGNVPHAAYVSEQHLLDLEREAFLGLCGQPKTLERIAHTLKAGKPLRN
jgi:3-hydroxyacyl-CoA dehydrogenase